MTVWQSDLFCCSDLNSPEKEWLLIICEQQVNGYGDDPQKGIIYQAKCPQSQVNGEWLTSQLAQARQKAVPDKIKIFRPQIVGLFTIATTNLKIPLEVTRRTPEIKKQISKYTTENSSVISSKNYLALDRPPPQNLPENIWGENWSFVSISAGEVTNFTNNYPLPFCDLPKSLLQINSKLDRTVKIPGIVIYGGKKSLILARWLVQQQPIALNYIPTEIDRSGGLVLESGLVDRWILATFEAENVANAAKNYEQAKQVTQGLHFLLIQPDDSGMTYTGFWLLKDE